MVLCEICGEKPAKGKFSVEGAVLSVCEKCGKFGEPIKDFFIKKRKRLSVEEKESEIVSNYFELIRKSREKLGMTQKELANKLPEKESVISKIEQGELIPTIQTAKKLEKILNVSLISEKKDEVFSSNKKERTEEFTLGDLIKLKTKK